jgi:arsenate reductase
MSLSDSPHYDEKNTVAMTMAITIYHNARCGTSRNTLAAIRDAGYEPQIIDYLANPPTRDTLTRLIADAGITVREAVRSKEAVFTELGLGQPGISDAALLDAMAAHPILIERPFVLTPNGVRLCRPFTRVSEIL